MRNTFWQFTRSQRTALSFFVMTVFAGSVSIFLIHRANQVIEELTAITDVYYNTYK